mgnify:CR=1 FL=1
MLIRDHVATRDDAYVARPTADYLAESRTGASTEATTRSGSTSTASTTT